MNSNGVDSLLRERPFRPASAAVSSLNLKTRLSPIGVRPKSAVDVSRPGWKNPLAIGSRPMKRGRVTLNHHSIESKVSKKAPFASRSIEGKTKVDMPKVVNGKVYAMPEYNPLGDPHLHDYYARKLGMKPSLLDGGYKPGSHRSKRAANCTYLLTVKTGEQKGSGTDANVFVCLRGTKGKIPVVQLSSEFTTRSDGELYDFAIRSQESFQFKGLDVGELIAVEIEHDGVERNQGWFIEEVVVVKEKSGKAWTLPCEQWLSLYDGDCQVKRTLKPIASDSGQRVVYELQVITGDVRGAGTDAHVSITLFGDRGQTPKVQLLNRNINTFERNQTDVFKIKTKSMGRLSKMKIEHDNTGFGPGWFLDKVIVTNLNNPRQKYYFPCNKWLSDSEGDQQTSRYLLATKSLDNIKEDHKYRVSTHTGRCRGAGTDANVSITLFGEEGDSGDHKLKASGNNFERGKVDIFEMNTPYLGQLRRIRIGHDNSGIAAGWFLDKISIQDAEGKTFQFPCDRWLSKTEDDGQITLDLHLDGLEAPTGFPYHLHITTGDVRSSSTSAKVYVILHTGKDGQTNSGKVFLENGKKDNFNRGRTDLFQIDCAEEMSPLHHLTIGHDNSGIGAGWFLDKVIVDSPSTGIMQTFPSKSWLADDEGDCLIERDLSEDVDLRVMKEIKVVWQVNVWTSDLRGAGTDANVFVAMCGDKGRTEDTPLGNKTDNFERGQTDQFKVEMKDIGKPYKLRIWHDDAKMYADWHLEKVEIINTITKDTYQFTCNRWLAKGEDDGEVLRELPATGSLIESPLEVTNYRLLVHTGDKRGAGTDANVFVNVVGEYGDTGNRKLKKSANRNKFERKQVDEFPMEAVTLGDLSSIKIGHDGKGRGDGWFLDKVIINKVDEADHEFQFICNRWLATDEDDGLIVRELPVGDTATLLKTTSYHVSVKTGDVRGAGTDANAFIHLFGNEGDTGSMRLRQAMHTKNKFERGRVDMFKLESMDIGKLIKIIIGHDGKGFGDGWHIESVKIDVPSRGEQFLFSCNRWLAADEDDGKIERELYPSEELKLAKKIPYEINIVTGDIRGAGTNANVFVVLYGTDRRKSDEIWLKSKTDTFERAQTDIFKVECDEVGPLTKIRIGHDNKGFSAAWNLDKVLIRRLPPEDRRSALSLKSVGSSDEDLYCTYLFPCNRWFAKDEDDKQIVRELVPYDETGSRRLNNSLPDNSYSVHVFTGDMKGGGSNSNVFLAIYGENGDSGERQLVKSETHMDKFERNQEDIFKIDCVSLGELSKVKIRHDNSGLRPAWFLDRIEINDDLNGTNVIFPCNRWLSKGEDDGQISRELVAVSKASFERRRTRSSIKHGGNISRSDTVDLEQKASMTTFEVTVATGDIRGAGTDANVFVTLYGDNGDTGKVPLKSSKTHKDKFERNQSDVFTVEAVDIGSLKQLRIGHDNKGGMAGWYLDHVIIDAVSMGKKWKFPIGRWLDKDKEDGKLEIDLYPDEGQQEEFIPHIPYEITIYTSDIGSSGTDANVFINIYGSEGLSTGQVDLTETKKKRKECFNRGSVDTFVRELEDVGETIEKIRIGHDNKGFNAGWHLNKIEIRRLLSGEDSSATFTFPCGRWFAKGEDDGAIVRELVPDKVLEEKITKSGKLVEKEKTLDSLAVQNYKIHVYTGDMRKAGTDANVFLTLFGENGDTGERQLAKSEIHKDKFERGQEDIFTIEAADLGYINKAVIRHDNSLLNPSWFLDRVEVINSNESEKRYIFHCERWLSKSKDDGKIQKSLYEKNFQGDKSSLYSSRMSFAGSNQSIDDDTTSLHSRKSSMSHGGALSSKKIRRSSTADDMFDKEYAGNTHKKSNAGHSDVIPYTIKLFTGKEKDHGTSANVFIVLIGTQAVSEMIDLDLVEKESFMPSSVETFSIDSCDVGELKKIELGHDGYRPNDTWYVNHIEINVPTTGKKFHIPCDAWLGKNKEDGKTRRIFSVSDEKSVSYKAKILHDMTIYTGDVNGAGTDSTVYFKLHGLSGSTSEIVLQKEDDRFERGSIDLIKVDLEDVGTPSKLQIGHRGDGTRKNWFLEKILLRNHNTDQITCFKCNKWMSTVESDDGLIFRELPAEIDGKRVIEETSYKIHVHTGDMRGGGTDANVYLVMFGIKGSSEELPLKNSETNKDKFERNQTDTFTFSMLSLGDIFKIRIWHDNKFPRSAWYLRQVEIIDENTGYTFEFPCSRWLAKNEDDGSLVREIPCSNLPEEKKRKQKGKKDLQMTLVTSDLKSAGTNHNAFITLQDINDNTSKALTIENSTKKQLFRRGQSDDVELSVPSSFGDIQRVTVNHIRRKGAPIKDTESGNKWHLQDIIVKDTMTGNSFTFSCNEWLMLSDGSTGAVTFEKSSAAKSRKTSIRELKPVQYDIVVVTADIAHAGTNANVMITLYGENGDTGKRPLKKKFKDLFERGQRDDFKIEALDLGKLNKLTIEHDNKGFSSGWMLDSVEISYNGETVIFPCNQWLDKKKGDKLLCRDLYPGGQ